MPVHPPHSRSVKRVELRRARFSHDPQMRQSGLRTDNHPTLRGIVSGELVKRTRRNRANRCPREPVEAATTLLRLESRVRIPSPAPMFSMA